MRRAVFAPSFSVDQGLQALVGRIGTIEGSGAFVTAKMDSGDVLHDIPTDAFHDIPSPVYVPEGTLSAREYVFASEDGIRSNDNGAHVRVVQNIKPDDLGRGMIEFKSTRRMRYWPWEIALCEDQ